MNIPQLALLQLLSNRDKHQHMTPILLPPTGFYFPGGVFPASTAPGTFPWEPLGVTTTTEPLELGAVALRVRLRDPKSRARVGAESYVVPSVSLPRYGPLIPALDRIGIFVRRVLAEFDPLI